MAGQKFTEREAAMIAAYRAGKKVTAIEAEFDVGRSTLYHVLRRAGVTPARSRKQTDAASGDARLAGLAELIGHQDGLIRELQERTAKLERENKSLRTKLDSSNGNGRRQPARRHHRAG